MQADRTIFDPTRSHGVPPSPTVNGPEAARALRPVVAEEAAASEEDRTLTKRTVAALWDSGLMQWFNPAEAGGSEPTFAGMIDTWVELAWQDASVGWIGIANFPSAAASAAYLPDEGFTEVFTDHGNRVTMGGQFFPNGVAETVDGGYRLTGSWNFGSGTGHSEYVAAGFIPMTDGDHGDGRQRAAAAQGGRDPPPRDRLHRRVVRAGTEGHRVL